MNKNTPPSSPSEDIRVLYEKALRLSSKSDYASAETLLTGILHQNPAFEDAYEALAVILYNQKKYDTAIDWLKRWSKLNPNALMAHTNLSRCYVAKGMILEAEAAQNEARRLTWKEELKAKKQSMPRVSVDDEIKKYKRIIELDPSDVLGYFSIAQAYFKAGMFRDAADIFEKAVEVNPQHTASYAGFGESLEKLGDFTKAKRIYKRGIEIGTVTGDMMPQKRMEALLKKIESEKHPG